MEKWYESESERQNINGKQGKNIESGDPQKDFKESRKILVPTTYETDNLNLRRNSTSDRTDRLLILGDFGRFQRVSPFSWGILSFPCKSPQMGRNLNLSPESPLFPPIWVSFPSVFNELSPVEVSVRQEDENLSEGRIQSQEVGFSCFPLSFVYDWNKNNSIVINNVQSSEQYWKIIYIFAMLNES